MNDSHPRHSTEASGYRAAGVDLAAAESAKERIARAVATTRTRWVVGQAGAFGGMVRLPDDIANPTLVMSTDGVGTKVLVAEQAGRYDTVGQDLVNHCVNDILVHGARPVAFMDYLAGAGLSIDTIAVVVEGVALACRAHDMALSGGETAQMPGVYRPGSFDLAGTIIGVADETRTLHGDRIAEGDYLVGYASSGLHTNGYTLARRIVVHDLGLQVDDRLGDTGLSVADALLEVHRSYFGAVWPVIEHIHGMAHITGGGIAGNLVRILPDWAVAAVDAGSWEVPELFRVLQDGGSVSTAEMREVFNLGIGLIAAVPESGLEPVRQAATAAGIETWIIGDIRTGDRREVRFMT